MNQHQKTEKEVSVAGICGSLRTRSFTRMALKTALEFLKRWEEAPINPGGIK